MSMIWEIEFPTQSQLLIALKLADFANDDGGSVYPSRDRLSRNAQCSETTVKVVLRSFREIGLLHVVREGGKGPRSTTEYVWNVGLVEALVQGLCTIEGGGEEVEIKWADKGAEFDPLEELRGRSDPLRGRPDANKGAASRPQPFTNHHLDSSLGAGAPATLRAARPTLEVKQGDLSWSDWLEAIEQHLGADARRTVAQAGRVMVAARWPKPGVPMPDISIVRDPTGEAA